MYFLTSSILFLGKAAVKEVALPITKLSIFSHGLPTLQMSRTQKNKATEYHLGQLKAKLAKLRTQLQEPAKVGPSVNACKILPNNCYFRTDLGFSNSDIM